MKEPHMGVPSTRKVVGAIPAHGPTLPTRLVVKLMQRHAQGKHPRTVQRLVLKAVSRRLNMGYRTRTGTTGAGANDVEKP